MIDEEGNWDFCITYVIVQDNMNACDNNESMAMVSGTIKDWKQQTVEEVKVKAMADMEMMTQEDGHYQFELATNQDYTVRPEKDINPLNGVSTFDLVLISKHILGIQAFENPYQMIAADVNGSGTITAFDMVQMRQLILNITSEYPNSPSWKFVYADYEFETDAPMTENYPQVAQIADLQQDMQMDFVAVKIGDVNGNARPNSLLSVESRTTNDVFEIFTEDKDLKVGETYNLTFSTKQLSAIQGYQFTLGFRDLEFEKLQSGVTGIENFGLHKIGKGMITSSWNQSVDGGEQLAEQLATRNSQPVTLFTLEFTAKTNGKLSEQLSLLNRPTAMEAYSAGKGEIMDVQLAFTTSLYNDQFKLFQNSPNPFHNNTSIGFYLPRDSEVELILRDEIGRVIKTLKGEYTKGYQQFDLTEEQLPNGFIYYQVTSKFGSKGKKMLRLK